MLSSLGTVEAAILPVDDSPLVANAPRVEIIPGADPKLGEAAPDAPDPDPPPVEVVVVKRPLMPRSTPTPNDPLLLMLA